MSQQGTGTTITFGTSAFTFGVIDIEGPNESNDPVMTTDMATADAHTYEPADLNEPGIIRGQGVYALGSQPPVGGAVEVITLTPQGGAKAVTVDGFLSSHNPRFAINERMVFDFEIKCSGAVDRDS